MSITARVAADQDGMVSVQLPSGAVFPVHDEEYLYFTERVELYLTQNHFVNISDLQDVDRMVILELMVYRWGNWLSRQKDWWGDSIDENDTQRKLREFSTELRQLKRLLGIDKNSRDKLKGDDSVSAYISNLKMRAMEFGVMRERQLDKALELFQQMKALLTLHDNCDEIERRENHCTPEDVFEWLREVAILEYDEVDAYFRSHQQKLWIRNQ